MLIPFGSLGEGLRRSPMASTRKETTRSDSSVVTKLHVADESVRGSASWRARQTMLASIGQALLIALILFTFLGAWNRNWRTPLSFSSDSMVFLMQSKSTMDNGWWWSNPRLSAPSTLDALAFPENTNVDQAIVWIVSRFTRNLALCVNLAWLAMVVLSGLTASSCMRKLGASTVASFTAGTLFAISPYAIYRNIDHFCLVIYLVPFAGSAALLLVSGRVPERWTWKDAGLLLMGSALLGFDYVYYAFFGCFFLSVAALAGFFNYRDKRILRAGTL